MCSTCFVLHFTVSKWTYKYTRTHSTTYHNEMHIDYGSVHYIFAPRAPHWHITLRDRDSRCARAINFTTNCDGYRHYYFPFEHWNITVWIRLRSISLSLLLTLYVYCIRIFFFGERKRIYLFNMVCMTHYSKELYSCLKFVETASDLIFFSYSHNFCGMYSK